MTNYISLFFALLLIALSGCVAPTAKVPAPPLEEVPISPTNSKAEFATGMGLAASGDLKGALPHLKKINPKDLDAKEQAAVVQALANFDLSASKGARSDLDEWTAKVLNAYHTYWLRVMKGDLTAEAGERQLIETLAPLVGVVGESGKPVDMDLLEPKLDEQIRARGYFSQLGVTSPYRELLLWRTQHDQTYEVELPDGREAVAVSMLEDFISIGWTGFATGDYYHVGGWATQERLFCVREVYDLDSETFRVSYLAHEGQHFADYKRFPKLEGPELEYRAKLVEIAYADTTLPKLLNMFGAQGSTKRELPHGYANRRVMNDLARALNLAAPADAWWESIPPAMIRSSALRLLNEDSQRLGRESAH